VTVARLCGITPDAPIGGCDPPQPASVAARLTLKAKRLCANVLMGRGLL
jgi:hypothetical protein